MMHGLLHVTGRRRAARLMASAAGPALFRGTAHRQFGLANQPVER